MKKTFTARRRAIVTALAAAIAAPAISFAQSADKPVRIGYTMSRTGPYAPGAQVSQEPNYVLWAQQVNAAGGLSVKGQKRKVELVAYDDRSEIETAVRTYEKLMGSDKVDLILPPWGSAMNFAIAPLANRYGYPFLAPTALSRKLIDMQLPYFFSLLQQPDKMMGALVDMLKANNVKTIAVVYMDDLFGIENMASLRLALRGTNIQIIESKSYPLGVKDLSPVLKSIKAMNPDAFIGITYPPDTILASTQSREIEFNPKFFYASVGTAFPLYKQRIGANAEGVLGMGSWNSKVTPEAKVYFDAHTSQMKKEPDRWASGHAWAGLEILQQSVDKVGLDRKALRDYIANNEFNTILGKIRFSRGENASVPGTVGQWQNGEFEVVWPQARATAKLVTAKPAWK
ncbi:branched-chain amino acid ABC transporter substrate-binding protein [Noviherbaspirillum cavernae]|uniref:Branched-chain amino acid ABC transporter substrate-binding protein n=1 Tax=Noviherbaspirillum cavernae TaxID=2320862 RepID=A0A418WV34_9BURK|nr:amino acid ABC transporter substrate-binding protein [Noviherbaspirillum cavernae]RJF96508.1 branched-chain amino acid ABC transporter substrate-binding protein [Noviherbaspirillum cavernae]